LLLAAVFRVLEPAVGTLAPALALLRYLAYINLMLGLFNLIPGFRWMVGASLEASCGV